MVRLVGRRWKVCKSSNWQLVNIKPPLKRPKTPPDKKKWLGANLYDGRSHEHHETSICFSILFSRGEIILCWSDRGVGVNGCSLQQNDVVFQLTAPAPARWGELDSRGGAIHATRQILWGELQGQWSKWLQAKTSLASMDFRSVVCRQRASGASLEHHKTINEGVGTTLPNPDTNPWGPCSAGSEPFPDRQRWLHF